MVNISSLGVRSAMVGSWLIIIALFLYAPRFTPLLNDDQGINILTWADVFDPAVIAAFQEETGIRVNMSYFENNEEVLSKLILADQGTSVGYDLVITTDYMIDQLVKRNLLAPIDRHKLTFWSDLDPLFLGHYYDQDARYAVPYYWDVYGIGYNKAFFGGVQPRASWRLIFDPAVAPAHIGMIEDAYESVMIAAQYLYGDISLLGTEQLGAIKNLLIRQKSFLEAYSELRGDYLLVSGTSPLVVSQAAYLSRSMRHNEDIGIMIPREGSFIVIDGFVIPRTSTKTESTYRLLNFLFSVENVKNNYDQFGYLPTTRTVLTMVDLKHLGGKSAVLAPERFKKFSFFRRSVPESVINDVWVDVKAS